MAQSSYANIVQKGIQKFQNSEEQNNGGAPEFDENLKSDTSESDGQINNTEPDEKRPDFSDNYHDDQEDEKDQTPENKSVIETKITSQLEEFSSDPRGKKEETLQNGPVLNRIGAFVAPRWNSMGNQASNICHQNSTPHIPSTYNYVYPPNSQPLIYPNNNQVGPNCHQCPNANTSLFRESPTPAPRFTNQSANNVQGQTSNAGRNYKRNVYEFKKIEDCKPNLEQLINSNQSLKGRKIYSLISIPLSGKAYPLPYPQNAQALKDIWDDNHVKMPYSKRNGNEWQQIKAVLKNGLKSVQYLEDSIKKYNKSYSNTNFNVLKEFFRQYDWKNFQTTLTSMAKLALNLPHLVTKSVPLLKQRQNSILFLSQYQIACLLANAFFCTFPRRSRKNDEYKTYPTFNFGSLFSSEKGQNEMKIKIEKLKCIFWYFHQVEVNIPNGVVTFERRNQNHDKIVWDMSDKPLSGLKLETGTIETGGKGYTEVDFANKYIGGGVLNAGCVQEEMRFLMCPELIVSRLFTEMLTDSETLVITGCKQYISLKGYSHQFEFDGDHKGNLNRDQWSRYYTQVVAMDATEFCIKSDPNQFERSSILRTLNKAYCGFCDYTQYSTGINPAIASGKWGCGAFNGDPYLVCLLQLMAASQADRNLILFIQNDMNFKREVEDFYRLALNKNITIKDIFSSIISYSSSPRHSSPKNILQFIINRLNNF